MPKITSFKRIFSSEYYFGRDITKDLKKDKGYYERSFEVKP